MGVGEAEAAVGGIEERGYAVVAQVADGAFVGVMHLFHRLEFAGLDFQPHFLVRVAERHPFAYQAVYFFDREHVFVARVIRNAILYL